MLRIAISQNSTRNKGYRLELSTSHLKRALYFIYSYHKHTIHILKEVMFLKPSSFSPKLRNMVNMLRLLCKRFGIRYTYIWRKRLERLRLDLQVLSCDGKRLKYVGYNVNICYFFELLVLRHVIVYVYHNFKLN